MDTINLSYLLDMGDIEVTNWLIENQGDFVLVKKEDLGISCIENAKQSLFRVGKEINEDARIVNKSKSIAVAHILNELSDLENELESNNE